MPWAIGLFWISRLRDLALFLTISATAISVLASANESSNDDALQAAFQRYLDAQTEALALYRQSPFFDSDQAMADAYRGVLQYTIGSIKTGALSSHDHPRFARFVDWTSKAGLENPDNNYYGALIADDGVYRITGRRGSHAQLIFQLVIGQPGVGSAGSSTNVDVLYGHELKTDPDGQFSIIVSRERPEDASNWIRNAEGAETLIVRSTFNDWLGEEHAPLLIERIDKPLTAAPANSSEAMIAALDRASQSLVDRTRSWLNLADNMWNRAPRNFLSPPRATRGGLIGQYSAFGNWDLQPDEALLVTFQTGDAPYVAIQLGSLWFTSLDYETRITSLNGYQLGCAPQSDCTLVIAGQDPGIANWLDTAGYSRGLIFMRWQGLAAMPAEATWPTVTKVRSAQLAEHIGSEIPRISAEARAAQRRARIQGVHTRFGG